jgi:hypothetical protein
MGSLYTVVLPTVELVLQFAGPAVVAFFIPLALHYVIHDRTFSEWFNALIGLFVCSFILVWIHTLHIPYYQWTASLGFGIGMCLWLLGVYGRPDRT